MSDTLLLNADGQPLSYLPLSTISWQEAIKYMVLDKASVIDFYSNWVVRSSRWITQVPSILMIREYTKPKQTVKFSRSNVYLRDQFQCSYCLKKLQRKECSIDHVLPVSKGGKTNFENTVTSCTTCNASKGNNHKVVPKFKPYKPSYFELVNKRKNFSFLIRQESWREFLN